MSDRVRRGTGGTLHSRTGQLRRSLRWRSYGTDLSTLGSHVYSDGKIAPYNVVHEFGAHIWAKNAYANLPGGPFLNIPSRQNKTPAGVTRLSARDVFAQGGYIVEIDAPRARYAVMLSGEPMYWLVKDVKIPPRLKLQETGEDEIPTLLSELREALGRAIDA